MGQIPLSVYLRQALDVAASLGGHGSGAPAVARVPPNERLSFSNLPVVAKDESEARLTSMNRACQEAKLREVAVEAYEKRKVAKDEEEYVPSLVRLTTDDFMPP